jgi:hypothetical protein
MNDQIKIILSALFIITLISLLMGSSRVISRINYSDIGGRVKIIGILNKPIGEIVTLEGAIIDGTYTRKKGDSDKVLLMVHSINGKKIQKVVNLPIRIFKWSDINMPKVNDYKKYIGYETGEMSGIPQKAFNYMPQATTEGFHFSTYFQICKELK